MLPDVLESAVGQHVSGKKLRVAFAGRDRQCTHEVAGEVSSRVG
nr:hypothetical protein [Rhodococcus sp. JVH1]